MSSTVERQVAVHLPADWIVRRPGEMAELIEGLRAIPGVTPEDRAELSADLAEVIDRSAADGLVLIAGFIQPLEDEPVEMGDLPTEVPFDPDDIEPSAVVASMALFQRPRPDGTVDELVAALTATVARWLGPPEVLEDQPIGTIVVTRELDGIRTPAMKRTVDSVETTYYVLPEAAPETLLVVVFRSPSLGFATELGWLYDAVIASLDLVDLDGGPVTPEEPQGPAEPALDGPA